MASLVGYKYHQSLTQYRIPYYDDGSFGRPETVKQFTTEIGTPKFKKAKKQVAMSSEIQEAEEI